MAGRYGWMADTDPKAFRVYGWSPDDGVK